MTLTVWRALQKYERICLKQFFSDAAFDYYWHLKKVQKPLRINKPKTFNDKLCWLKRNHRLPQQKIYSDKLRVRDFVADRIGENYLVPLLGIYRSWGEINFSKLPQSFVLKCNHASGYNAIVHNKVQMDKSKMATQFEQWMAEDFFWANREWNYLGIPRRILCETLLSGDETTQGDLRDYKLFCFNGKVHFIQIDTQRHTNHQRYIYDTKWIRQDFTYTYAKGEEDLERPEGLDEMIFLAEKLAEDTIFIRNDFYFTNGRLYFGEMTHYPEAGFCIFNPSSANERIGEMLDISAATHATSA